MFNNKLFKQTMVSIVMVTTTAPTMEAAAPARAWHAKTVERPGAADNHEQTTRKNRFKRFWKISLKTTLIRAAQVLGVLAILYRCIGILRGQEPLPHYATQGPAQHYPAAATPPGQLNPEKQGVCGICGDEKMLMPLSCHHDNYCADCLGRMLDTALKDPTVRIKCPTKGCQNLFEQDGSRCMQDPNKLEKLQARLDGAKLNAIPCPTPDCKYTFINNTYASQFRCPQCNIKYCTRCRMEHSEKLTCRQAQARKKTAEWVDTDFAKRCPKCKKGKVAKDGGCNRMLCPTCNHNFCWHCLKPWIVGRGDGVYACSKGCPVWDPGTEPK